MIKEYVQNGEFYFTADTDPQLMAFINRAYKSKSRIVIEYKEGWEDFSGYHGGNGLKHSMYIGKSTGTKPIPLKISRSDSMGGYSLTTCQKSIKRYYVK